MISNPVHTVITHLTRDVDIENIKINLKKYGFTGKIELGNDFDDFTF